MEAKSYLVYGSDNTQKNYIVEFLHKRINTLVTLDPFKAREWFSRIEEKYSHGLIIENATVGLNTLTPPNTNRPSLLQIFVGTDCLLFQIAKCNNEFGSGQKLSHLGHFFSQQRFTYVGDYIWSKKESIENHYSLHIGGRFVDVFDVAEMAKERNRLGTPEIIEWRQAMQNFRVSPHEWRRDTDVLTDTDVCCATFLAFMGPETYRLLKAAMPD